MLLSPEPWLLFPLLLLLSHEPRSERSCCPMLCVLPSEGGPRMLEAEQLLLLVKSHLACSLSRPLPSCSESAAVVSILRPPLLFPKKLLLLLLLAGQAGESSMTGDLSGSH